MAADPEAVRENVKARYAEAARAVTAGREARLRQRLVLRDDFDDDARSSARRCTTPSSAPGSPPQPRRRASGAATPLPSPSCARARRCSTSARAAASTCCLSAGRVGPTGVVYGLDMTEEMLALAQRNKVEAGATNVHFLRGEIENVPLPAESVDVVISNCVINLSTDKAQVLREIARVLRPGGRVGVSDVVAEDRLSPERAGRARRLGGLHRRRALRLRVRRRPRGRRARGRRGRPSRTRSPTACTERSCGRVKPESPAPGAAARRRRGSRCRAVRPPAAASGRGEPLEEEAADEDEATDDDERERPGNGVERAEVVEEDLGEAEAEERQPAVAQQARVADQAGDQEPEPDQRPEDAHGHVPALEVGLDRAAEGALGEIEDPEREHVERRDADRSGRSSAGTPVLRTGARLRRRRSRAPPRGLRRAWRTRSRSATAASRGRARQGSSPRRRPRPPTTVAPRAAVSSAGR